MLDILQVQVQLYLVKMDRNICILIQHLFYLIKILKMISTASQKIQLFLSCRNLKDLDYFSKSDPYIKVSFRRDFNVKQYAPYGRTQTINNELNPNYKKTFQIDYIFECRQDIKFDVFDDDNGSDDFIGNCETTIGALMGAKNQTSILDLKCEGKIKGKLVVRCQKLTQSNQYMRMKFKGVKLMNTDSMFDFWDKSDPYLKFIKFRDDNTQIQVARTDKVLNNLNPSWNSVDVQLERLVNQNIGAFRVECWDWEESGKDNFIGEATIKLDNLMSSKGPIQIALNNPKKKKPGVLVLQKFQLISKPSFVDYLKGGLQLNMIIAVDFTGSNGTPTSPNSLHYMDPAKPNQYQAAIMAISNILMNYDSDKRIPCFGFGAQTHFPRLNSNTVNHCFPLSGEYEQVQAMGMQHLLQLYNQALKSVSLSGPTYFGPLIQETMKLALSCKQQGSRSYQTLLILTDGDIHDMEKTIELVYSSAALPLSIIIVGVGEAGFESMVRLDGDGGSLFNSKGQRVPRDLVQFVPFRDVKFNPDMLAKQLLAELPSQLVQYMAHMGILPGKPQQLNIDELAPIKKFQE